MNDLTYEVPFSPQTHDPGSKFSVRDISRW